VRLKVAPLDAAFRDKFAGGLGAIPLMNRKREVLRNVDLLMETGEAELVKGIVEILYRKTERHAP
jgi:hypothetical protein